MNLLELQRRMSDDVRRPLTPNFQMQPEAGNETSRRDVAASYISPSRLLTSFQRLEIYNRQYWFRLIDAVSEDFPALKAVVGAKRFEALVLAYLRETPSTSWTLRDLGAMLPSWLIGHAEFTAGRHVLAMDVARLEWAYVDAFDSGKNTPLCTEDIQALGAETRLELQPHIQLLKLDYPVDELVMAVHKAAPETEMVSNAASNRKQRSNTPFPKMRRMQVNLIVHRFDDLVYYRRIDPTAFLLLSALQGGSTIAEAITRAFAGSKLTSEQQVLKIHKYFAHAAELGWFCQTITEPPREMCVV